MNQGAMFGLFGSFISRKSGLPPDFLEINDPKKQAWLEEASLEGLDIRMFFISKHVESLEPGNTMPSTATPAVSMAGCLFAGCVVAR